jgi:[NiFe] hydrogenase small subunit
LGIEYRKLYGFHLQFSINREEIIYIHDQCQRRSHFENDEFVTDFGAPEAALGYCLYKVGCRGPETYNNCPTVKFQGGTSWPVQAGHPCIGCSEPDFWDKMSPFYQEM